MVRGEANQQCKSFLIYIQIPRCLASNITFCDKFSFFLIHPSSFSPSHSWAHSRDSGVWRDLSQGSNSSGKKSALISHGGHRWINNSHTCSTVIIISSLVHVNVSFMVCWSYTTGMSIQVAVIPLSSADDYMEHKTYSSLVFLNLVQPMYHQIFELFRVGRCCVDHKSGIHGLIKLIKLTAPTVDKVHLTHQWKRLMSSSVLHSKFSGHVFIWCAVRNASEAKCFSKSSDGHTVSSS